MGKKRRIKQPKPPKPEPEPLLHTKFDEYYYDVSDSNNYANDISHDTLTFYKVINYDTRVATLQQIAIQQIHYNPQLPPTYFSDGVKIQVRESIRWHGSPFDNLVVGSLLLYPLKSRLSELLDLVAPCMVSASWFENAEMMEKARVRCDVFRDELAAAAL
jgi:hypothetical protein